MRFPPAALLLLAVVAVHGSAVFGGYVYDDTLLLTKNAAVANFDLITLLTAPLYGVEQPYWRPLTMLVLALGHHLGGAAGVHAFALLLHATNTLLVFSLAQRWLGERAFRHAAVWVAALFALHPVQVEAVAWCAAINDPLWVTFTLLALRSTRPWLAAICCLLAMLSKENAIVALPLVWWAARSQGPQPVRGTTPALLAALAVWLGLRALVFGELTGGLLRGPTLPAADASAALFGVDLFVQHLRLLLLPAPLTPFHELQPALPRAIAALAIVLTAAALLRKHHGQLTGTDRLALGLVVLPLLLPSLAWRALGAHPVGERYLYLPALGLALLLVGASGQLRPAVRTTALTLLTVLFAALSLLQTRIWRDQEHLALHGLAHAPHDAKVLVMAGAVALRAAQTGDRNALGSAHDRYAAAERAAAALGDAGNRQLGEARLGLAWCLSLAQAQGASMTGAQVIAAFRRAVDTDPHNAAAWIGLGVAHGMHDQPGQAQQAFERGLQLDPGSSEGWCNLGFLHLRTGRRDAARDALQRSLACDPGNARAAELLAELR